MLFQVDLHDLFILCVFGAVWGGIWASFLECMVWRLQRGIPLSKRSYCPSCGHKLSPLDLVPVFSWFLLGGKCRYCGAKIPVSHTVSEIAFAIISVLCILQYGITILMVRNWLFLCCLFCIALSEWDGEEKIDIAYIVGFLVWIGTLPWMGVSVRDVVVHVLFCVAIFAFFDYFMHIPIAFFDFSPFRGYGYHSECAGLFSFTTLYLRLLPAFLSLVLSCILLFFLRAIMKSGSESPFGSLIAMMSVSSAVILLLGI